MNRSTTIILAILVLGIGGFILLFEKDSATTYERELSSTRAFPFDVERIDYLRIETGAYIAECRKTGNGWRLIEPAGARLDGGEMDRILYGLSSLTRGEVISSAERAERGLSLSEYGLDEPGLRLSWGAGLVKSAVEIGRAAPLGGQLYFMEQESGDIISTETNLLSIVPATLSDLRERIVFRGPADAVDRIDIRRAGGYIQLAKLGQGRWRIQQPLDARADTSRITAMLDRLLGLRIATFVADDVADALAYGIHKDSPAVTVRSKGGITEQVVVFGHEMDSNTNLVYAQIESEQAIYGIDRDILRHITVDVVDLRDRRLLELRDHQVSHVTLKAKDQTIEIIEKEPGSWWVTQPSFYEAEYDRVMGFVRRWANARVETFVDDPSTNAAELGLEDALHTISLRQRPAAGSAETQNETTITIGAVDADAETLAVMVSGETTGFKVDKDLFDTLSFSPLYFRTRTVLEIPARHIDRVTRRTSDGEQVVEREQGGAFASAEPNFRVDQEAVQKMLIAVGGLRISNFVSEDIEKLSSFGLDEPAIELGFDLAGEGAIRKTLLIGKSLESGGVYAMLRGEDVVFVLDSAVGDQVSRPLFVRDAAPTESTAPSGE